MTGESPSGTVCEIHLAIEEMLEPGWNDNKYIKQRNGALIRVHAAVCSKTT